MKWTTETTLKVCFIERMRLLRDRVSIKCCWTIAMSRIIIEITVRPVSQPLVLSRGNRQIIHADIVVVSECVAIKRRQLFLLLYCGCIGGISEPVEIRGA